MITKLPEAIKKLSRELAELPSIGPRQATRLAFFLISQGENAIKILAEDIDALRNIKICERCFFVHQNPSTGSTGSPQAGSGQVKSESLCDICSSSTRKIGIIAIIEKETDLLSLENSGKFNGRYLILGPIPKTGLLEDWQKLRLQNLKSFIQKELKGHADEIILALNPTNVGDFHASLLTKELEPLTKKISRLGRGLPTGGEIEFADDETLGSAIEKRD
jgi:recombination protein RecR